jgi:very-short-patch-repair endonuclease
MAKDFARALRRRMTDAERKLWRLLRSGRFEEFKFRRQQPLGPYVADFVCFDRRLVIEIDGGEHFRRAKADAIRTKWMEAKGYRVIRFWNSQVLGKVEAVLEEMARSLNSGRHPSPLKERERKKGQAANGREHPSPPPSPSRGEGV